MKTKLTLILLVLSVCTGKAQTDEVAGTPALDYDWRPGFLSITEITGGPGIGVTSVPYSKYYFGINTMAAYQFTRNIKAGVGIGLHRHNENTMFPIYVDTRYSLNAREFVPFFSAAGGIALSLNDPTSKVWMFINPAAGVKWVVANRTGVSLSTGLMAMTGGGSRHSFINFKLGVEFKFKERLLKR